VSLVLSTPWDIQSDFGARFLKGLFEGGGFKQDAKAKEADLRATYQAIIALKTLNQWDSFNSNRKDTVDQIKKFVSSHQVLIMVNFNPC
jgi:prenyltransferase beta subunit